MTFASGNQNTIEQTATIKVQIIGSTIITATTGAVGLSQRYVSLLQGLHNTQKLSHTKPIDVATFVSETMIGEFRRTMSPAQHQPNMGWGMGCLLGMIVSGKPELFEFDYLQFHPERKGDPDATGTHRSPRFVSMGSGQALADPFLGFIWNAFWKGKAGPLVSDAKLAVAWTLQHVIELNAGGIGGDPRIAVLAKNGNQWKAEFIDTGEIQGQVADLMEYIGEYRTKIKAASEPAGQAAAIPQKT